MKNFDPLDEKLKKVKPKPLTQDEKDMLWSRIESGLGNNKPRFSLSQFFSFFSLSNTRFVFASLLILVLIGGSATTVAASNNAKPGDILFPIDIAVEKIHIIISSGGKKDKLRIKFAEERLNEVRIILAFEDSGHNDTTYDDDHAANTATSTQDGDQSDSPATATTTPKKHSQKAENALATARAYLEAVRNILEERSNNTGAAVIDGIIDELVLLQEQNLDELKVKIKNKKNNDIKISIKAKIGNLKTEIKFEEKQRKDKSKGKNKKSVEVENGKYESKIKISIKRIFKIGHENENGKITICHNPKKNAKTITISKKAWSAHSAHGDIKEECDNEDGEENDDNNGDGTSTTTPDIISPVLSSIIHSVSTTTARITWTTDESATSFVAYDTTSGFDPDSSAHVSSSATTTSHALNIVGLTASTTYYYIVRSTDESGNTATSSEHSFATNALPVEPTPDTTPPVLSNISATSTAATSVVINWQTNETSTSNLWYSTTTPLTITSSTPSLINNSLITDHSMALSVLTASTTYYFIVSSSDTSGNTASSSEQSFMTLP